MFITRECDYAVRIVRALAPGNRMAVKDVCDAEHIPQPYAYKILKKMEKAGLVQSFRGVYGGYTLAKPLAEISLFDIFLSVEEEMLLNECLQEDYQCPNNLHGCACSIHTVLCGVQNELVGMLRSHTMDTVLEQ